MRKLSPEEAAKLIDSILSIHWCRENLVCPYAIKTENQEQEFQQTLIIAIGNLAYLDSIGDFLSKRFSTSGYLAEFTEKSSGEIQVLIEQASERSSIRGRATGVTDNIETLFSDEDLILSIKNVDEDNEGGQIIDSRFEYDDSEEELRVEDTYIDLSKELKGSKIQIAAAKILIICTRSGASDISLDPYHDGYKVRVRRDGCLHSYVTMPTSVGIKLLDYFKLMAGMDIEEKNTCQDGRMSCIYEGQTCQFLCAVSPAKYGEMLVIRNFAPYFTIPDLDALISDKNVKDKIRNAINQSYGLIIFSGPNGSGKGTTLASALQEIDSGELRIVTAEDPIEYDLGGNIIQFQVTEKNGRTYKNLLKTFLRQDPDVILIGELRNLETAEACMDAAETGHLLFTTMATNSASAALSLLQEMGLPSYRINSSLRGVISQRLMRRVCPSCCTQRPINEAESRMTGLPKGMNLCFADALSAEEKMNRNSQGTLCECCTGTGYRGRIAVYEYLTITKSIREAIKAQKSPDEIEEIACQDGMTTIKHNAIELLTQQLTTISEFIHLTNG